MPHSNHTPRSRELIETAQSRVLVLDGAMGTALQSLRLTAADFGGEEFEGCNEHLVLTRPEVIQKVHEDYLAAGCDIVETNTFGGTPLVLAEYGLGERAREINRRAAELARAAAARFSTAEKPRFVAGSVGPTTKSLSVTGGVAFDELIQHFHAQAQGLAEGGVDYFLIETCQDTRNIKAALVALDRLFDERKTTWPIAVSATVEANGTLLAGQNVEALAISLEHRDLLYLGLNCATGPEFMTDSIRTLARLSPFPVACVPNAGLPDSNGRYLESPEMVARVVARFLDEGWLGFVGGCCGTHAGHIRALSEIAARARPAPRIAKPRTSRLAGIDPLEISDEMRPVLVGERCNVIGSRKFKTLVTEGRWDEAAELARTQVKSGAQIIDVCLANPDRDEKADMIRFLSTAAARVRAPLMFDSTDPAVLEACFPFSQGKAIINSVNLEDGEERVERVLPWVKRYGAALVVGTIDDDLEQGMGVTRDRKLAIARRAYRLLHDKHEIPAEDIYWDPLVFPCGTGDENYRKSAPETIAAITELKAEFPGTRTILGISNVSFGLPPNGRETLNSVFLHHCVKAGLDLAIVNAEKIVRYASIPAEDREVCENLLYARGADPVAAFAAHFRAKEGATRSAAQVSREERAKVPVETRLSQAIVEGLIEHLPEDLEEALAKLPPLEIVNGPLMRGMDEVGRLFNANQLIVAEVLQSAEAMKSAVARLTPHLEKQLKGSGASATTSRGRILLATVKGDVHDIGKNLVGIILENNGFEVVDLGIKVSPEALIQAVREKKPDILGLSGLLVKSAQQMVLTAADLVSAGSVPPMLVGGAALSERFVDEKIAAAYAGGLAIYAKDAMQGLELAKRLRAPAGPAQIAEELAKRRHTSEAPAAVSVKAPGAGGIDGSSTPGERTPNTASRPRSVEILKDLPKPGDFDRHVLRSIPIEEIWRWINPLMLYSRHLGLRGATVRKLLAAAEGDLDARSEVKASDPRGLKVFEAVEEVKAEFRKTPMLRPASVYRFFRAESHGNTILLKSGSHERSAQLDFLRQNRPEGLCLADYVAPENDSIALFVTTVGQGVREASRALRDRGEYLKSHILQALAVESAEAYAELTHSQLRLAWGYADPPSMTMMERFQARYRGKRYSFGYPACPRLEDQRVIFDLLQPREIGVELTEGYMMDPEASVSAVVFHHPQACYFSVGTAVAPESQRS